jgi:Mg/Co/Ni transporter MgtE
VRPGHRRPGASLEEAARLLIEHRSSSLPVVDPEAHVVGAVSEAGVLRLVGEAMTSLRGDGRATDRSAPPRSAEAHALVDPAVVGAPLVTTLVDATGLPIHFGSAQLLVG